MQESQVNILRFEALKDMYKEDSDFREAYASCKNPISKDKSPWEDYMLQEGLLFNDNKLCIPKCSMRENLLKEKNNGSLARHFGKNKTLAQLSAYYFWPRIQVDVKRFVERCRIC